MVYRYNPQSKENSSPMSISAPVVAFVIFVLGLCFVYLWRHISKARYISNQLETTIQERYHTCNREAGLI